MSTARGAIPEGTKMTRSEAIKIGIVNFAAMKRETHKTYTLPRDEMHRRIGEIEARFAYKNGFMTVGCFCLSNTEFAPKR
jgi:hypothetical protein